MGLAHQPKERRGRKWSSAGNEGPSGLAREMARRLDRPEEPGSWLGLQARPEVATGQPNRGKARFGLNLMVRLGGFRGIKQIRPRLVFSLRYFPANINTHQ